MNDEEKILKGLEHCRKYGTLCGQDCNGHYEYTDDLQDIIKANNHRKDCPYGRCRTGCVVTLVDDVLALLKEQQHIIRCKDCKFYWGNGWCNRSGIHLEVNDEWFCADGVKKNDSN